MARWCFESGKTGGEGDEEGGPARDGEDVVVGLEEEVVELVPLIVRI